MLFYNYMTTVVNKKTDDYDILIQRGTKWGNPFIIVDSRNDAIDKFKPYFMNKIRSGEISISDLRELYGKRLGCSCKPKRCHGDYIAECVNIMFSDLYDHTAKEKYFEMEINLDDEH